MKKAGSEREERGEIMYQGPSALWPSIRGRQQPSASIYYPSTQRCSIFLACDVMPLKYNSQIDYSLIFSMGAI